MPLEHPYRLAGLRIHSRTVASQPAAAISPPSGDQETSLTHFECAWRNAAELTATDIPDPDSVVLSAGNQGGTIGRPGDAVDPFLVPQKDSSAFAGHSQMVTEVSALPRRETLRQATMRDTRCVRGDPSVLRIGLVSLPRGESCLLHAMDEPAMGSRPHLHRRGLHAQVRSN